MRPSKENDALDEDRHHGPVAGLAAEPRRELAGTAGACRQCGRRVDPPLWRPGPDLPAMDQWLPDLLARRRRPAVLLEHRARLPAGGDQLRAACRAGEMISV